MKQAQSGVALLLVFALLLSACQQPSASTATSAPPASPTKAGGASSGATSGNENEASTSNENTAGSTGEAESLELSNVSEGLSSLNSYKTTFTMSFQGTKDGQPDTWTWTMEETYRKDPPAKHVVMSGSGSSTEAINGIETIEVEGKTYSKFGDICASSDSTGAPQANATFSPSDIIGDIRGSQFVGVENINGVPAKHYVVDMSSFLKIGDYTSAKGEAWVADPGNFVVKYVFEATGKDTFFGSGSNTEGTLHWDYEVNSVNQPVDITAPENCGGAPADIPVMSDAKDVSSFGEMTTYTSPSAFDDVVNFYKEAMTAGGWTEAEGGMAMENFAMLNFTKEGRTASINITFDPAKNETTVLVSVTEK